MRSEKSYDFNFEMTDAIPYIIQSVCRFIRSYPNEEETKEIRLIKPE